MFCKHCGQAVERGYKFCGNCGAPIPQEQIESEAVIAQAAAPAGAYTSDDATWETDAAKSPPAVSTPEPPQSTTAPPSNWQNTGRNRRGELPALNPVEKLPCPRCKKLVRKDDRVCEWCGRELRRAGAPESQAASGLSFAGYADAKPTPKEEVKAPPPTAMRMQRRVVRRRRSAPVLEILVAILLLGGAATAIWIMRSSLPVSSAALGEGVKVTVTPATARVAKGKTLDVLATVSGTDTIEVNWSIQEGDAGGHVESRGAKAVKGKVWSQAVYTAPKTPGIYHLLAESKVASDKSAEVVITVVNR
jgi:chitinase